VRLLHIHRISSKVVNNFQVLFEHIRVLVIFAGDILLNSGRKGNAMGMAKREGQYIPKYTLAQKEPKGDGIYFKTYELEAMAPTQLFLWTNAHGYRVWYRVGRKFRWHGWV